MNYSMNDVCSCGNCVGETCRCGCQAAVVTQPSDTRPYCACAGGCGCEAAEQGCNCNH